ncbi:unnamed protein product [Protopolystoma xenopodis]|uniref:Uncharacterized protein n=1 Tax=Protopolystoma xenopodis TaxID=117903 RepID=A0A3S5A632_9PLAT|nr:unnamed protein product [Protopolystoma xenopodis]
MRPSVGKYQDELGGMAEKDESSFSLPAIEKLSYGCQFVSGDTDAGSLLQSECKNEVEEIEYVKASVSELQKSLEEATGLLDISRQQVECLQAERDSLQSRAEALQTSADDSGRALAVKTRELEAALGRLAEVNSERDSLAAKLDTFKAAGEDNDHSLSVIQTELKELRNQYEVLRADRDTLQGDLEETRTSYLARQFELLEAHRQLEESTVDKSEMRQELETCKAMLESQRQRLSEAAALQEEAQKQIADLKLECEARQVEIDDLKTSTCEANLQLERALAEWNTLQAKNDVMTMETTDLKKSLEERKQLLSEAELRLEESHRQCEVVQAQLDCFKEEKSEALEQQKQLVALQADYATAQEALAFLNASHDEDRLQLVQVKTDLEKATIRSAELHHQLTVSQTSADVSYQSLTAARSEADETCLKLAQVSSQRDALQTELRCLTEALEATQQAKERAEFEFDEAKKQVLALQADSENIKISNEEEMRKAEKQIENMSLELNILKVSLDHSKASEIESDQTVAGARKELAELQTRLEDLQCAFEASQAEVAILRDGQQEGATYHQVLASESADLDAVRTESAPLQTELENVRVPKEASFDEALRQVKSLVCERDSQLADRVALNSSNKQTDLTLLVPQQLGDATCLHLGLAHTDSVFEASQPQQTPTDLSCQADEALTTDFVEPQASAIVEKGNEELRHEHHRLEELQATLLQVHDQTMLAGVCEEMTVSQGTSLQPELCTLNEEMATLRAELSSLQEENASLKLKVWCWRFYATADDILWNHLSMNNFDFWYGEQASGAFSKSVATEKLFSTIENGLCCVVLINHAD